MEEMSQGMCRCKRCKHFLGVVCPERSPAIWSIFRQPRNEARISMYIGDFEHRYNLIGKDGVDPPSWIYYMPRGLHADGYTIKIGEEYNRIANFRKWKAVKGYPKFTGDNSHDRRGDLHRWLLSSSRAPFYESGVGVNGELPEVFNPCLGPLFQEVLEISNRFKDFGHDFTNWWDEREFTQLTPEQKRDYDYTALTDLVAFLEAHPIEIVHTSEGTARTVIENSMILLNQTPRLILDRVDEFNPEFSYFLTDVHEDVMSLISNNKSIDSRRNNLNYPTQIARLNSPAFREHLDLLDIVPGEEFFIEL